VVRLSPAAPELAAESLCARESTLWKAATLSHRDSAGVGVVGARHLGVGATVTSGSLAMSVSVSIAKLPCRALAVLHGQSTPPSDSAAAAHRQLHSLLGEHLPRIVLLIDMSIDSSTEPHLPTTNHDSASLLTRGQVACRLGVSLRTVDRLTEAGLLRRVRLMGSVRFTERDVARLIAASRDAES